MNTLLPAVKAYVDARSREFGWISEIRHKALLALAHFRGAGTPGRKTQLI